MILSGTSCITEDTFNDSPDGNFEALWKIIDEHYCFLEYKNQEYGLDWNKIHADYKKRLTSSMSNEQLFDVLSEMLNELRPQCLYPKQTIIIEQDWVRFLESARQISDGQLAEREASLQFDDPVNIQYTSGTTGHPKGATLSHHNILNNGFFIGERLKYTEKDIVCLPVPFYHCFGMVLGNMAIVTHGACIVIPGEYFIPEQVLQTVEAEKCTSLYGVPTMFIAELDLPNFSDFNLKSLRTGIMAGAPCPIDTMRKVQSLMNMTEICVCYGMTETSPVSTESCTDDPLELRVTTVGKVHPHVEIKIIDPETGSIVPRGTAGETLETVYTAEENLRVLTWEIFRLMEIMCILKLFLCCPKEGDSQKEEK